MRYFVGFLILCAVAMAVFWVGCGQSCSQAGCGDGVRVNLVPEIEATYDVSLVLDGEAGAFTCVRRDSGDWTQPDAIGAAVLFVCTGEGFTLESAPESVEIAVNAQGGSWNGSLTTSPTYELNQPNGPDCPPTCRFARLTITNDVGLEVQP